MPDKATDEERKTIAIAAGGTGGHFFPALSIAENCRQRGHRVVFFIGGQHAPEHAALAERQQYETFQLPTPRLTGKARRRATFPFLFLYGWHKARRQLKAVHPDAVLGMGSFAAATACAAAISLRVPLILHEGNAVLGTANRFFARWARTLAVSLPLHEAPVDSSLVRETGMPLRPRLLAASQNLPERNHARETYGLMRDKPVLLVFGGSQGASYLNELIPDSIAAMAEATRGFQIVHLTGNACDTTALKQRYSDLAIQAEVRVREDDMQHCYAAADLAVCRAGAATIAELALFGIPPVLIPLPAAVRNHQLINARVLAAKNAAAILEQAPDAAQRLAAFLESWMLDDAPWQERGKNIRRFAHADAAASVTDLLLNRSFHMVSDSSG